MQKVQFYLVGVQNQVKLQRMSQIFKGSFSSSLEKIWTQLRQGVIDLFRNKYDL